MLTKATKWTLAWAEVMAVSAMMMYASAFYLIFEWSYIGRYFGAAVLMFATLFFTYSLSEIMDISRPQYELRELIKGEAKKRKVPKDSLILEAYALWITQNTEEKK